MKTGDEIKVGNKIRKIKYLTVRGTPKVFTTIEELIKEYPDEKIYIRFMDTGAMSYNFLKSKGYIS